MKARESAIACGVLAALILGVYAQAIGFDFVRYDDPRYITENPQVQAGLTRESVAWAFTTFHKSNWHPLAWLSHMLDVELFGLDPAGHHATNVVLHLLNACLLFGWLRAMTGEAWPSFGVAAVFAVHPLHVESVAWVAERKDVLSSTFGLLSLWAYVRFATHRRRRDYALALGAFVLSLLAKPMWVTLPCVLLLLDSWPLGRLGPKPQRWLRPGLEKLPFFGLSAASSVVTIMAQRAGGATGWLDPSFGERLATGLVAYATYLGKCFWPSDLAVFYPHPYSGSGVPISVEAAVLAGAILVAVTVWVVRSGRGYAIVGWLWFVGTLFPVSGVMQAGLQGMADRYTYYPSIGLSIAVAWGVHEFFAHPRPAPVRAASSLVAALLLAALTAAGWAQARVWRDSRTLFEHTLEVVPSAVIHDNLGAFFGRQGDDQRALHHYREAVAIDPGYRNAHRNLAYKLRSQGALREAAEHWLHASRIPLDSARGQLNLGVASEASGDLAAAIEHYRAALELDPSLEGARERLAAALDRETAQP